MHLLRIHFPKILAQRARHHCAVSENSLAIVRRLGVIILAGVTIALVTFTYYFDLV